VGFRFTARSIAEEFGVSGWIKNLGDSRVEILAEAPEETLKKFLDKITQYFSRYIQDTEIEWQPASGEFKDFTIAF